MANKVLVSLLKDYESKRSSAELDLESRKQKLFALLPELEEIEEEINSFGIKTTKLLLLNKDDVSLKEFYDKLDELKKRKEEILVSNGYDASYLKPFYECPVCNDTGFVEVDNRSEMCSCLKQRLLDISYDSSNLSNLKNENFSTFDANIFSDEVDFAKFGQRISPRKNILNIKENALSFVENFDDPSYNNLLFTGNTGLGKSFMSSCIAFELIQRNKTVLYQTSSVLLESIIDYKMSKDKDFDNNVYKSALSVDLLIIDDLGTESLNSMKLDELFNVINTRILNFNKVTKTIISTNLSIKDIFESYEERIGSRIAGHYDIYRFFGNDLRFKGRK